MKTHRPSNTVKRTIQTSIQTTIVGLLFALTLACGYGSTNYPPVAGTLPAITQLNPDAATAGGADFMLTVEGSNFGTKAVVNWNGIAQTANTTYVTANQLTVAVPATLIANAGMATITVTNPATSGTGMYGSGGTLAETSKAVNFTIN